MTKQIIRRFQFRSSRDASLVYTTLLYSDGSASCNCKGWTQHKGKDGTRNCKHLISAGIAPVSESVAVSNVKQPWKKTSGSKSAGKQGEAAQPSMRVVRKFQFED